MEKKPMNWKKLIPYGVIAVMLIAGWLIYRNSFITLTRFEYQTLKAGQAEQVK